MFPSALLPGHTFHKILDSVIKESPAEHLAVIIPFSPPKDRFPERVSSLKAYAALYFCPALVIHGHAICKQQEEKAL